MILRERWLIMKKSLYLFFTFLMCFIAPLYASEANKHPVIELNKLAYKPLHELQLMEDTFYISGEDLAMLTYGKYSSHEKESELVIQNKKIIYSSENNKIQIDGISKTLSHPTHLVQDVIYLPIEVLDYIEYPYNLSDNHMLLQIMPLLPYSTSTDDYTSHREFTTSSRNLTEILKPVMKEEAAAQELIDKCKQEASYISLTSTTYKTRCFEEIEALLNSSQYYKSEINVYLRQITNSNGTPTLSKFDKLPLHYKFTNNGLELKIGDKAYKSQLFWSTYSPYQNDFVAIDLNKSFDAMLMREIYNDYRNRYDLKDDIDTNPVVTIQMRRSDQMRYHVYFDDAQNPTPYQVIIYKMCTAQADNYYVDFVRP